MANWNKTHPTLYFVGLFVLQMIVFYVFYFNPWIQFHFFGPLVNLYASLSGKILNLLGQQTIAIGDTVSSSHFSVGIKKGCDAAEPMAMFIAGILAFPSAVKKKIYGLIIGIGALFILNLIRIISLYYIGAHYPELFDTMHIEVWQVVFIMVAIAFWFFWIRSGRLNTTTR